MWIPTSFNASIAPGPKKYDFNMQQIAITKKRAKAVDFSEGYYDNVQAIVSIKGSKIDGATSIADLKDAKLGVPIGTTSYDFVVDTIQPDQEPAVFDDQAGAVQALENGQVDGIVTDLYTAFYLRDVEVGERHHRGPVPGRCGDGAVRAELREGQPARHVREPGDRGDQGRRHARRDHAEVARGQGRRSGHQRVARAAVRR